MRCGPEPEKNFARATQFVREAAGKGAQIVCFPELFRSQYFCQTEDHKNFELAEEVPGESTAALGDVARETGTVIIASLFEKRSAGVYHNTAAVIDTKGKFIGKYRKMHVPDDPLYHEKFYFAPGDLGFQAWSTAHGKIGVCVCWDQWYPEAARLTALRGAEGNDPAQSRDCEWLLRRCGESRRSRSASRRRRHRILGTKFCLRTRRRSHCKRFRGQRRDCDGRRRMGSGI